MNVHDLLIVGAGPVGLALGSALRNAGLDVVIADARPPQASTSDPRVLALAHGTRLTLENLNAWQELPTTPIQHIHISQQGGFGRTLIDASDHGIDALGYVASAGDLASTLGQTLEASSIKLRYQAKVTRLSTCADHVEAELSLDGDNTETICARLVACAEGGLSDDGEQVQRDYGQHAIIAHVACPSGHGNRAFERFTPSGPMALLPCGNGFALVHVCSPQQADTMLSLPAETYQAHIQTVIGSRVRLGSVTGRLRYPLGLRYRREPTAQRIAWLGNAAQTLHPVAGQGFNLALRDVHALAQAILAASRDTGEAAMLRDYAARRTLDRRGTIHFTDSLVRLFSHPSPVLSHIRGGGLFALDLCAPLRHFVARRMMFGARAWP